MVQSITDNTAFLIEAGQAVRELSEYTSTIETDRLEEKRLEKALEAEKKAVTDSIGITVKKRMEEINSSYDQEISKGQDRLKKVRSKREKAKSQGVKERINEETSELHDHNKELRLQMKTLFQQEHVPGFCKSTWFYSLYFPHRFKEIMIMLATLMVCFLAVPYGIYLLIPDKKSIYLIGIYFVGIIIFGGIYIIINDKTKVHHQGALKQGRAIRDTIYSNDKKIRVITGSIRRDRDEAFYNLEKYDDEISQIEQELAEITNKKKEALNTFDKVTKTIISDEIQNNSKARLDQLQADFNKITEELRIRDTAIKEKSLYITDHYEPYIGREFLTPDKLDELTDLVRTGKAANISEAVTIYKNSKS